MGKYLKLFNTHSQYESYTADTATFIKPNVSYCLNVPNEVHYNPLKCEETTTYELVGTPSYPSEVDGASTSFNMTFNYKRTDINEKCKETITEGSDTVTVEIGANPSTASSRTVEGTYDYHGLEIPYSVTQTKFEAKATAKFNVTDTSKPTKIGYNKYISGFSEIEIDGVVQPSVVSAYTFSTTGEHTVKYILRNPTNIVYSAFRNCSGLTSIYIPNGVTTIDNSAFSECSSLTSIEIPDSVTSIGGYVFSACTSLTSLTIPSGVTSIGNETFYKCSSLTSIDIPDSVTSIGSWAFFDCSGLTSCTIGSGVTSIGDNAFYNCSGLTSVNITSGVTSIGMYAFCGCSSLTSITSNAMTAPTIQSTTFQSVMTGGTLTVPSGSAGYDVWMGTGNYYLGKYSWTKVEQ